MDVESLPIDGFDIEVSLRDDRVVVAARGAVDPSSVGRLRRCVDAAASLGEPVELDLQAVSFFDAAGVRALLEIDRAYGHRVRRGLTSRAVWRTLDLCGLAALLSHAGPSTQAREAGARGGVAARHSTIRDADLAWMHAAGAVERAEAVVSACRQVQRRCFQAQWAAAEAQRQSARVRSEARALRAARRAAATGS